MVSQEGAENRLSSINKLLTTDSSERVAFGLNLFRDVVGSERFRKILTTLGFKLLQDRFVGETARLILQEDRKGFFQGESIVFKPDDTREKEGGRYAKVYSPRAGVAELTAYFPKEERVLAAGLVNWGVIKKDEAESLRPLFNGGKPFLRLVAMDSSILNNDNLKPFVESTHSDELDLKPITFINSIESRFKGNPLYEVSMYAGTVRVVRYEKGKVMETEEWVTVPPVEGEGFLLVGKRVNTQVA